MANDVRPDDSGIADLRYALKRWEKSFADSNGGRKPTREDIKKDATIAAKYEEYRVLQRKSGRDPPMLQETDKRQESTNTAEVLKERSSNAIAAMPRKQSRSSKILLHTASPAKLEAEQTPACVRFALGPTPQKDGEVLGIFDVLPAATPSKRVTTTAVITESLVSATPSKPVASSSEPKASKTPQSSGKRFFLDAFAGTPLKRKREDEVYTPSTANRQYATPAFLRRNFPLARIDEDEESSDITGAAPPFKKRGGFVRSLSSIIQGLKKQEEKRMDDEWDIMNEMEAEERDEAVSQDVPKVIIEDSQAHEMPLGPDQGVESSDEASDVDPGALDANGKPRKVWKKKGLKRQTRRVKMKPVLNKPKKATDHDQSDTGSEVDVVEETQLDTASRQKRQTSDDLLFESENDAEGSNDKHDRPQARVQSTKDTSKKKIGKRKDVGCNKQDYQEDDTTSKPKKVNALAHTNFRKLKIKNKNSKANGRGRKFGRRYS